jgi:hypothetical protein
MANVNAERFICTEEQNVLTTAHSVLTQTGKLVYSVETVYICQREQGGGTVSSEKMSLFSKGHIYVAKDNGARHT